LHEFDPTDRPYSLLAQVYALAGRPDIAKAILRVADTAQHVRFRGREQARAAAEGEIALAEHRYGDALAAFRRADQGICSICGLPNLARAHDLLGNADSTIALLERFVTLPDGWTAENAYARMAQVHTSGCVSCTSRAAHRAIASGQPRIGRASSTCGRMPTRHCSRRCARRGASWPICSAAKGHRATMMPNAMGVVCHRERSEGA
jgi:hypothetical protein